MSLATGIRDHYKLFGIRGILCTTACRVFHWPREIEVRAPGIAFPIFLRLRTSDTSLYRDILLRGEYRMDGIEPRIIVDAGANCGLASIYFANRYTSARIFAIEPEASNHELLVRNVAPYSNVTPIRAAIWNRDGEVGIGTKGLEKLDHDRWAFAVSENGSQKVRAVTMPTLMREYGIDSIDLLKMDIEGAEKEAFEVEGWADKVNIAMIEIHDQPGGRKTVEGAMQGYTVSDSGETTIFIRKAFHR